MKVHPVNLLWQRRYRGLLPFVSNSLSDNGVALLVRPDELEARTYQVLSLPPDGQAVEVAAISVETVKKFEVVPSGEIMLGVTDDDIYLFREGRKTRFLADRRVSYSDVALARQGGLFACSFSDLMFASHTVALGDMGGRLGWTKDQEAGVSRVAMAADGRTLAVGRSDGIVLALDHLRSSLWEYIQEEPITGLAMSTDGGFCAAGTQAGSLIVLDRTGDIVWRTSLGQPAVSVAIDATGEWVAAAAGEGGAGLLICFGPNGFPIWEYDLDALPTGVALSPNGRYLGLSMTDGRALLFEVDLSASMAMNRARDQALEEVESLAAAGDLSSARERLVNLLETNPAYVAAGERLAEIEDRLVTDQTEAARALSAAGQHREALDVLAEAQAQVPYHEGLFQARCSLRRVAADEFLARAAACLEAGDHPGALALLADLLRIDPRFVGAREQMAEVQAQMANQLLVQGDDLLAQGDSLAALERWQQARNLAASPELEERIHRVELQRCMELGIALYNEQRMAEAVFQFKKALSLDPSHEEALRYVHYAQGGDTSIAGRFERLE